MIHVVSANKGEYSPQIREIFWEYLQWVNARINEEYGVNFDIETLLETEMGNLDKYLPPKGRLLLGYAEEDLAGVACLKYLTAEIGEIKRMYVRPGNRKRGLGRALLEQLLIEAVQSGYDRIRLDSAGFMKEAHQLYRTTGFSEIGAYEGSEIPKEFQKNWIFMEMELSISTTQDRPT